MKIATTKKPKQLKKPLVINLNENSINELSSTLLDEIDIKSKKENSPPKAELKKYDPITSSLLGLITNRSPQIEAILRGMGSAYTINELQNHLKFSISNATINMQVFAHRLSLSKMLEEMEMLLDEKAARKKKLKRLLRKYRALIAAKAFQARINASIIAANQLQELQQRIKAIKQETITYEKDISAIMAAHYMAHQNHLNKIAELLALYANGNTNDFTKIAAQCLEESYEFEVAARAKVEKAHDYLQKSLEAYYKDNPDEGNFVKKEVIPELNAKRVHDQAQLFTQLHFFHKFREMQELKTLSIKDAAKIANGFMEIRQQDIALNAKTSQQLTPIGEKIHGTTSKYHGVLWDFNNRINSQIDNGYHPVEVEAPKTKNKHLTPKPPTYTKLDRR